MGKKNVLLLLIGMLILFGCTRNTGVEDTSNNIHTMESFKQEELYNEENNVNKGKFENNVEESLLIVNENDSEKDYLEIGFELMRTESIGLLTLGMEASEILNILGEPDEKTEFVNWGADGLDHQTWNYIKKGIKLDIVEDMEEKFLYMITVKSPNNFSTKRNIRIGNSKQDVINAYKFEINNDEEYKGLLVAGSIYGGVIFEIENDYVSAIFIGAAAE